MSDTVEQDAPSTVQERVIDTGLHAEPLVSPEAAAATRAAYMDSMRRRNPGQYVGLGNGQMVRVDGGYVHKYPGAPIAAMLGRPRELLLNPKPDFGPEMPRYVWRTRIEFDKTMSRDRETIRDQTAKRIRYVETKEVDPQCPFAVHEEWALPGGWKFVTCKSMVLCEVLDPNYSKDTYKSYTDEALWKLRNLPSEVAGSRHDGPTKIDEATDIAVKVKAHGTEIR